MLKKQSKQKGQSLIYVVALIAVLISGVFFVYDTGKIVNTKIKFQNAADSAALSAVALKINKHHMDQLVRTSMYHESLAAQSQNAAALSLLIKIALDADSPQVPIGGEGMSNIVQPNMPNANTNIKDESKRYRKLANLTYRHVVKLHRERKALEAYYSWLSDSSTGVAQQAVTDISRTAFRANAYGLAVSSNPALAQNLAILQSKNDLLENRKAFGEPIGGVAYADEGTSNKGTFGKTYVEFDGYGTTSSYGQRLLSYFNKYTLTTSASARIASSKELYGSSSNNSVNTNIGLISSSGLAYPFQMLWYSPRLMAIWKNTDSDFH